MKGLINIHDLLLRTCARGGTSASFLGLSNMIRCDVSLMMSTFLPPKSLHASWRHRTDSYKWVTKPSPLLSPPPLQYPLSSSSSSLCRPCRGHPQGGTPQSSSAAPPSARRVRQLPQVPAKISTVEEGEWRSIVCFSSAWVCVSATGFVLSYTFLVCKRPGEKPHGI